MTADATVPSVAFLQRTGAVNWVIIHRSCISDATRGFLCSGVAEFDTRAVGPAADNPRVELGGRTAVRCHSHRELRREVSMTSRLDYRLLNVALRPQSKALYAYAASAGIPDEVIAGGFRPRPAIDLTFHGGHTIRDLVFVNRYVGGHARWDDTDRKNVDSALQAVMTDPSLESIIAQYFRGGPISTTMLKSQFIENAVGKRFFKDQAEALVRDEIGAGALGDADPASTVLCLMLPRGVVLVDGNSDGSEIAAPHGRSVLIDDEAVDSTQGLGGFHGSVHIGGKSFYYAIGVYSEGHNGIVAFDKPWKNVVATFYHELCEARTDPDVEDVNRTNDESLLGWYSFAGRGEIGDLPMSLAGPDLSIVMQEVTLNNGTTEPVQLQWSNRVHGPEGPN
jgi:hypothetical protein